MALRAYVNTPRQPSSSGSVILLKTGSEILLGPKYGKYDKYGKYVLSVVAFDGRLDALFNGEFELADRTVMARRHPTP